MGVLPRPERGGHSRGPGQQDKGRALSVSGNAVFLQPVRGALSWRRVMVRTGAPHRLRHWN